MSIALEAKVTALEERAEQLQDAVIRLQAHVIALNEWRMQLEDRGFVARGKPGPKPKDSNG